MADSMLSYLKWQPRQETPHEEDSAHVEGDHSQRTGLVDTLFAVLYIVLCLYTFCTATWSFQMMDLPLLATFNVFGVVFRWTVPRWPKTSLAALFVTAAANVLLLEWRLFPLVVVFPFVFKAPFEFFSATASVNLWMPWTVLLVLPLRSSPVFTVWTMEILITLVEVIATQRTVEWHGQNCNFVVCPLPFVSVAFPALQFPQLVRIRHPFWAFLTRFLEPANSYTLTWIVVSDSSSWHAGHAVAQMLRHNLLSSRPLSYSLSFGIPLLFLAVASSHELYLTYVLFAVLRLQFAPILASINAMYALYCVDLDRLDSSSSSTHVLLRRIFANRQLRSSSNSLPS